MGFTGFISPRNFSGVMDSPTLFRRFLGWAHLLGKLLRVVLFPGRYGKICRFIICDSLASWDMSKSAPSNHGK